MDAGPVQGGKPDAGMRDGAVRMTGFVTTDASASGELQARMVVNGANVACGACAVLVVQAQGGQQPYSYQWSDPTLTGPGPQHVCPDAPTTYSVIVTDDSATGVGEFAQTAMQVEATGQVDCVADAGVSDDDFQGCLTPSPITTDAGADGGVGAGVQCNDGGVNFDLTTGVVGDVTVSTKLTDAFSNLSVFRAGHTYTYVADRLLPLTLAVQDGVQVDVWGATQPCALAEHLFTLHYDLFTWHQAACFTPKQDYTYLIVSVHLGGVLFYVDLLDSATVCSGCMM